MIELKNIIKTFKTKNEDINAVKGVSLKIDDGEIYGIIGFSGAGKSTLVRIINQLEPQTSGEVLIDGEDISKLSKKELNLKRQKIGMIFQHFNLLWSRTVRENIELPLEIAGVSKEQRNEKVLKLISLVGLEGRENAYPSELSGGQKQRIGIARALANDPTILLCDEATSALDPSTTESILGLLDKINKDMGITIVMITHQMEVVQRICHKIAVMSDGKVVEENTVLEIFEHPQHQVTKNFVHNVDDEDFETVVKELKKLYPFGQLLKLTFTGSISNKPVLSDVIKNCNIDVNIVDSDINYTHYGPMGEMYVHVSNGSDIDYNKFVNDLCDKKVEVRVL